MRRINPIRIFHADGRNEQSPSRKVHWDWFYKRPFDEGHLNEEGYEVKISLGALGNH